MTIKLHPRTAPKQQMYKLSLALINRVRTKERKVPRRAPIHPKDPIQEASSIFRSSANSDLMEGRAVAGQDRRIPWFRNLRLAM